MLLFLLFFLFFLRREFETKKNFLRQFCKRAQNLPVARIKLKAGSVIKKLVGFP